jgi:hypothetical protein
VSAEGLVSRSAIAWSGTATVGHIAVSTLTLTGELARGLPDCSLAPCGKFRNGAPRWWCVSHQCHWGVKADLARADGRCRAAAHPLSVALDPVVIDAGASGPAAPLLLSLDGAAIRIDGARTVQALAIKLAPGSMFAQRAINYVNVTPPALAALAQADGCVDCARCGYPHLDLGEFAARAHRRHTCGHCGHDATHSGAAIVSNPLFALMQAWPQQLRFLI